MIAILPVPALDALTLVTWVGLFVVVLLAGLGIAIVTQTVRFERTNRRKAAVRPAIRAALFDRLSRENPDWEAWGSELSAVERTVLKELLDRHLRLVDGSDRERLQPLATALGVDRRALRTLETGDRYEKLTALGWLALLDHPHDPELLWRTCAEDAALRAAGARVMLERQYDDAAAEGTRLLLGDPAKPLSTFGLDTLYELIQSRPDLLVQYAKVHHERWTPELLMQVFRVLRTASLLEVDTSLKWVVQQCEHESASVRAAAIRTLADSSWRSELRSRVPVEALTNDSSSDVRTAVYRTLGAWGDVKARETLARAARRERNPRCRLTAIREFNRGRENDRIDDGMKREFPQVSRWVAATQHSR